MLVWHSNSPISQKNPTSSDDISGRYETPGRRWLTGMLELLPKSPIVISVDHLPFYGDTGVRDGSQLHGKVPIGGRACGSTHICGRENFVLALASGTEGGTSVEVLNHESDQ